MAFDPAPSAWISSWSEDGTTISFDIANIDGLTAGLSDASTGDWRSCISLLVEHTLNYYNSLSGDKPTKLSMTSNYFVDADGILYKNTQIIVDLTDVVEPPVPPSE